MERRAHRITIKKTGIYSFLVLAPFILWCYTGVGLSSYVYPSNGLKGMTLVLALGFGVLMVIRERNGLRLALTPWDLLALASCLVLFIDNQNFLWGAYLPDMSYIILILVALILSRREDWMDMFFRLLTLGAAIHCFFTFLCYLSPSFYMGRIMPLFYTGGYNSLLMNYQKGYIAGLSDHVSTNGCYLTLLVGLTGSALISHRDRRAWRSMGLLLAAVALLLTGKRAHPIFSLAALFAVYWVYNSGRPRTRWLRAIGIGLLGLTAFFVLVQFIPELDNFIIKFRERSEMGDVTSGRGAMYAQAWSFFLDKPLLGIGWEGYKYFHLETYGVYVNVHNVYIQLLCETGIIGAGVFYSFFAVNALHCIKTFRLLSLEKGSQRDETACARMAFACFMQVFFLLYCITGNPLYDAIMVFPYIFSCSITQYYRRQLKERRYHGYRDTHLPQRP